MEKWKILIIILFFLLTLSAFSKEETFYKFEKIDTENGLNDDFINDIIEDRGGKLWIASRKGINIYDGNEIEKPESDKNILSNLYVVRLIENENGEMFVITDNQLIKYNHQTKNLSKEISFDEKGREKFGVVKVAFYLEKYKEIWIQRKIIPGEKNEIIRIFYDKLGIAIEKYPLRENDFCRKIVKTKNGEIYIASEKGVYHYLRKENRFEGLEIEGKVDLRVYDILLDTDSNIYLGTENGVYLYLETKKRFECIPEFKDTKGKNITTLFQDSSDSIWGATENGLFKVTKEKGTEFFKHDFLNKLLGKIIIETEDKKLWICEEFEPSKKYIPPGIVIFDIKDSIFTTILSRYYFQDGLSSNVLTKIMKDSKNNIWLGTADKGVLKYSLKKNRFMAFIAVPEKVDDFLDNHVRDIHEDSKGILWINNIDAGLRYNKIKENIGGKCFFNGESIKPNGIFEDRYGNVWIWTHDTIGKYDRERERFLFLDKRILPLDENYYNKKDFNINTLFTEDGNILYLGTPIGIYILDIKTWKSTQYLIPQEGVDSQELNYVEYITNDRNGEMWAATHDGLVKIEDIRKQQYKVFKTGKIKDTNNINSLTKIAFDLNGNLWTIGSRTVAKLSSDERKLEEINTIDNTGIEFRDIIFDKIGGAWISTSNGLYRMKKIAGLKDGYSVQWYGIEDGLQGIDFSQKASSYGSGGKLYFGGRNGYNVIYPEKMQEYFSIPELVINSMRVNDKKIELEKLSGKLDKITLRYFENNVEFYYYARDLTSPDTIHYKYMLRGADKTWIDAKNQKSVRYSNLNPGKYTFLVMSTNYDGIWAVNTKEINFEIFPPFWKTWWAYLLYVVVMFSGVAVFVRIKTSFQKMEIEKQKIVVEQLKKIDKMKDEYNKKLEFDVSERTLELKESLEKLRQTQDELIVSEKIASIGIFAGGIAHEINSPLAGVLTSTQLIQLDIEDIGVEDNEVVKDSLRESLATIVAGVKKAKDIITKLLKYTDRKESEFSKIELTALINNSLSLYEKEMKERKIELKINIEEDFEVNVNIREMTSAINNIIENAIDAIVLKGKEKGVIEITTSKNSESGASQIEITDNGLGMNEEVKQRMFDPFFTTKDVGKGMGLGMAVTYDIVKKHGGKILVKSVLGEGTSIILELI